MKSINGIITETKEDFSPFFEFTWEIVKGLCKYAHQDFNAKEMIEMRREWQMSLTREEAIRPILSECRKLMA